MEIINNFNSIYCFIVFVIIEIFIFFILLVITKEKKPKNNVHFYVARDKNGCLWLYMGKPLRGYTEFYSDEPYNYVEFNGSIELFGLNENDYANLKWEDEPVEVYLNLED